MLSEVVIKMRNSEVEAKTNYEKVKGDKALSKKQIAQAIEKIEEDWNETSKQYKKEVENIKGMDLKLSSLLQNKLDKVIEDIASKYKIDVVINTQIKETISVFYANKTVDITGLVIKRLNSVIPHVGIQDLK